MAEAQRVARANYIPLDRRSSPADSTSGSGTGTGTSTNSVVEDMIGRSMGYDGAMSGSSGGQTIMPQHMSYITQRAGSLDIPPVDQVVQVAPIEPAKAQQNAIVKGEAVEEKLIDFDD